MLQARYAEMLTQAAREGRTDDVQTLSDQMGQEIQALINTSTQSAVSPAGTNESEENEDWAEEEREGDDENADGDEEDGDWDEEEMEDDDLENQ